MWYQIKQLIKTILKQGIKLWYRIIGFFRNHRIIKSENGKKLLSYKNKHRGERCFLIGNGPSLCMEDLEKISKETSFACNIIYKVYDKVSWRPTYYFMSDVVAIHAVMKAGKLNEVIKSPLFSSKDVYDRIEGEKDNVIYLNRVNQKNYTVSKDILAYYVPAQATVMTLMIEMAIYMGMKEIYLLGVDCTNTFTAGHFEDSYTDKSVDEYNLEWVRKKTNRPHLTLKELGEERRLRSLDAYQKLKEYANKKQVKIYNATRGGALEVFERIDFDRIWRSS
ncbi:MAG: DUF115 domain-containing protein [Lachnospiraceae bacterium]